METDKLTILKFQQLHLDYDKTVAVIKIEFEQIKVFLLLRKNNINRRVGMNLINEYNTYIFELTQDVQYHCGDLPQHHNISTENQRNIDLILNYALIIRTLLNTDSLNINIIDHQLELCEKVPEIIRALQ
tara:strand:- start:241 stop:630 length:390 start_codon:yes stop_codon:yes gene_type:complete